MGPKTIPGKLIRNTKKIRKEVDLSGLREVLEEAIGPIQKTTVDSAVEKIPESKKEIKPGEEVDLGPAA